MPHRLIVIHGMGKHDDDWSDPVAAKLEELYDGFDRSPPLLTRKSFEERIQVVPLRYDGVLREILAEWAAANETLAQHADALDDGAVDRLTGWLDSSDLDEFAWSHAADVLLYRGFSLIRERVKVAIATDLAHAIAEAIEADDSWSVLAHSLGTSVLHDSLHALMTTPPPGLPGAFDPQNAQAVLVMMVANVSRVLQTTPHVLELDPPDPTVVAPGTPGAADRACQLYYNIAHELDPFLVVKPFDPLSWPDEQGVADGIYRRIPADHIHEANVHSLLHYLEHPAVHIPLFRALTWDSAIPLAQEAEHLAAFPQFNGLSDDQWREIKEHLEAARVGAPADSWEVIEKVWNAYDAARTWAAARGLGT